MWVPSAQIWVALVLTEKVLYPGKPISLPELGQLLMLLFIHLSIHLVILCEIPTASPRAEGYE